MMREGIPIERELLVALEYGFELKNLADYGEAERVSVQEARKGLQLAKEFVVRIEQLISDAG